MEAGAAVAVEEKEEKKRRDRGTGSIFKPKYKVRGEVRESRHFWLQYYRDGQRYMENTHSDKITVARELLKKRLGAEQFIKPQVQKIRVEELVLSAFRNAEINRLKSLYLSKKRWEKHLKEFFGTRLATHVSTDLLDEYVEKRLKAGADNATINRELALIRRAFVLAYKNKPRKVHDVPNFPHLVENPPRQGFVDDAQYNLLTQKCSEPWMRALLAAAYAFGFRVSELIKMRVRQVDMLNETITLDAGTTKNGEGRMVKMTREVYELLIACLRGKGSDDYVFTRANGSPVRDFRNTWHAMCVAAGLGRLTCPNCSGAFAAVRGNCQQCGKKPGRNGRPRYEGLIFHDLRRSAIRNLVREGVPERVAMRISGHKTRAVFDRYNIVSDADLVAAANKLDLRRQAENDKSTTKVPVPAKAIQTREPELTQ